MTSPSRELEPGTRIDGRYRIVGPIGAGGMGVVYRARDERLGRHVALKTLAAERVGDERARARLVREARAVAGLEHPGIAQIYDAGETDDGGAYLVMELVRGKSLRALMREGALDRDTLVDVLEEIALALDHAHAQGVVHRDVKPDNVMVREDGRAVLLDFGLAKDLDVAVADTLTPDTPDDQLGFTTKEGALVGTLTYLAPEQARGRDVGPKSDQFALATMAYEALFGRLPWDGTNTAAVLAQILVDDPPAPSSFDRALSPAVDEVFARALAKDPAARFESASAFVRALRAAFDAAWPATTARGELPTPSSPRGIPRVLGTVLLGVAVVAVLSIYWSYRDPHGAAPPLADSAVIACPVLEASGTTEPTGWLGAMAADLACQRMTWHLGGDPARTRAPAELLELARVAGDDFPADPWVADDARTRTLARARSLDAWIDGRVALDDGHARVALTLHARGGERIARGEGRGEALYIAVGQAIDALARSARVPRRDRIDPAIAPWVGLEQTASAILFDELGDASLSGVGVEARCGRLLGREREMALVAGEIRRTCVRWGVERARELAPPPLDASSPSRLALTAPEHAEELSEENVRQLAARLERAREREAHPFARATLAKAQIQLFEQLGDMERARDLALTAVEDLPRDWFLRVHLVRAMLGTPGAFAATRALAAWRPGSPEAWRTLALPVRRHPDRALPFLRRAYESGGALPLYGIYLADALLKEGHREEARAMAARYATSGRRGELAGELLRARVEISQAALGRAHERLERALLARARFGALVDGDVDAMDLYLELSRVLGREHESADPLVRRFVLHDPHRLVIDQPHYELESIALCMSASPELGRPCLARLRELRAARSARAGRIDGAGALLSGAERYLEGDRAGAVEAWRPLVRQGSLFVPPEVFAEAGEEELAERLERAHLRRDDFAGASLALVRAARGAHARGDDARARELAERVIDAWGAADVPVPAVDELRALVASLPVP